jgi:hypothetical protein
MCWLQFAFSCLCSCLELFVFGSIAALLTNHYRRRQRASCRCASGAYAATPPYSHIVTGFGTDSAESSLLAKIRESLQELG